MASSSFARIAVLGLGAAALTAGLAGIGAQRLREAWALVPGVPRARRVTGRPLSSVDHWPGLSLGTGCCHGLTMAPAVGEALADLVMGRRPGFDLTPYRCSRFSDGSELVLRA